MVTLKPLDRLAALAAIVGAAGVGGLTGVEAVVNDSANGVGVEKTWGVEAGHTFGAEPQSLALQKTREILTVKSEEVFEGDIESPDRLSVVKTDEIVPLAAESMVVEVGSDVGEGEVEHGVQEEDQVDSHALNRMRDLDPAVAPVVFVEERAVVEAVGIGAPRTEAITITKTEGGIVKALFGAHSFSFAGFAGEGCEVVFGQAAEDIEDEHAPGSLEVYSFADGDEGHVVVAQELNEAKEAKEVPVEPVNAINDDDVDEAGLDVVLQLSQSRTFVRGA